MLQRIKDSANLVVAELEVIWALAALWPVGLAFVLVSFCFLLGMEVITK